MDIKKTEQAKSDGQFGKQKKAKKGFKIVIDVIILACMALLQHREYNYTIKR